MQISGIDGCKNWGLVNAKIGNWRAFDLIDLTAAMLSRSGDLAVFVQVLKLLLCALMTAVHLVLPSIFHFNWIT